MSTALDGSDTQWHRLFGQRASQRTTTASTHCGTAGAAYCGAGRTTRRATDDSSGLSTTLGSDRRSRSTTDGPTDYCASVSTDMFPYGGSSGTTDRAAERGLGPAVSRNRGRDQEAAAQADDAQSGPFHWNTSQRARIFTSLALRKTGEV